MATQNQYTPQAVSLDGGLDFITPKVAVQGGSLSNCLNFERTDRVGYSRIGGYEPYDGKSSPSLNYTNAVALYTDTIPTYTVRAPVGEDVPFGYVAGDSILVGSQYGIPVVIFNFDEWAYIKHKLDSGDTANVTNIGVITKYSTFDDWWKLSFNKPHADAQELTVARNDYFSVVSNLVDAPGVSYNPIIGAVGYKDRLYAIKDLPELNFNSGNKQVYPGDTLKVGTSSYRIVDVNLVSGTWAGGNAVGTLVLDVQDVFAITNENADLIRDSTFTNVLHISTIATSSMAGLYVSTSTEQATELSVDPGWTAIDMGSYVSFDSGTKYGPFHIDRHGATDPYTAGDLTATDSGTSSVSTGWTIVGPATAADALKIDDVTHYITKAYTNQPTPTTFPSFTLTSFPKLSSFYNDPSATVTGIELKLKYGAANKIPNNVNLQLFPTANLKATLQHSGGAVVGATARNEGLGYTSSLTGGYGVLRELTLGGKDDLWGMTAAQAILLLDSTFGIDLQPYLQNIGDAGASAPMDFRFYMFYVEMTVYFSTKVEKYYFWNGTDDVTAVIPYFFKEDGDWDTEDANGIMQVSNITPVAPGSRTYISDGDEIRTSTNGGGLLIAKVSSAMRGNGLDTFKDIQDANSRYQFIVHNFFADESYEALYGVSGAGRAFSWDGYNLVKIYTQTDETKDKPRHVAAFQFHLILGYESGALMLSTAGEPLDFDGLNGATEIDTGDPIRGFALMQGTTLGVFCKKSIQGLIGTSIDNFSLSILNPYEGAIEYTVADIGRPIYCSYKGISMFDQSAAYGDFVGQRLSYKVTPWLIPRLQGAVSPVGVVAASAGPVCAVPVRTKNQYRLFFSDGYVLTMTLVGAEQTPMFTIQAYGLYHREILDLGTIWVWAGNIVPRAEASWVDEKGSEHIHLAHWSKVTPLDTYYMYEFDKSWSFNGRGIPAYIVSNQNFFGSPFDYDVVRKLRLHGTSVGYAPLHVFIDKNYNENNTRTYDPRVVVNCSLPREAATEISSDQQPTTTMSDVATRARSFSMRFMSYNTKEQGQDTIDPVDAPVSSPFVLQAMLIQHTQGKGDV